ncbi:MAG TPA: CoA transferase [Mycobacteriales bacterium]|nr:CoA transferase [Mycobacteriales bacterium]
MPNAGALAGLRVVDASSLYAAPFVATLLADQGADVVKIEPPGGDDYRHYPTRMWSLLARNKKSVVADLRTEEGCDLLRALVPDTDVLVVNMPPALLERRGLDWNRLSALNPELVMAAVSGFGLDGPYAGRPGNGTMAEGFAGLTYLTGDPDGPPVLPSVPLGDAVTGFAGAFGILAACYHRAQGGRGQLVDINPVDALLHTIGPALTAYAPPADPPKRLGSRLAGATVRNVFAAADGKWIAISASTPRHARDLATLCGHQQADADGPPVGDLEGSLRRWIATQPREAVLLQMVDGRLPAAPVNSVQDLLDDPHIQARQAVQWVATAEAGDIANPAPAPRLLGSPAPTGGRTPDVGEHTDEILARIAARREHP